MFPMHASTTDTVGVALQEKTCTRVQVDSEAATHSKCVALCVDAHVAYAVCCVCACAFLARVYFPWLVA